MAACPDRRQRSTVRTLVASSRPFSWVNTALPFLAGALLVNRQLTPVALLGTLYFTLPYNLLLYGVNDLFDHASDLRNPRKGSIEGARVPPSMAPALWIAAAVTNLPVLVGLAWLGGSRAVPLLALTVLVALAYSVPPVRTKVRPGLDSLTSALHFALPVAAGMLIAGRPVAGLPWLGLGGFVAWGVASHALGAIQDTAYDRAAGIGSIATALGPRATAVVSMVAYLLAVTAAALSGPIGVVAAVVVLPYALLPLSVLARPDEARAHRAWRSFLGLNLLAGFLLTQLLLRYWNVTTWTPPDLLVAAALVGNGVVGLNLLLDIALLGRPRSAVPAVRLPSLTAVIPARNESRRIEAAIRSLQAQDYPGLRILVADDDSSDATADIAASLLGRQAVLRCPPRPASWTGKSWAAWNAASGATTELVLFLDADTELAPGAARTLAQDLVRHGDDLLSGVTRYAMGTRAERILMPGFPMLLFGYVPLWLTAVTRGRVPWLAFAYGPLVLVRREAYLATGGHAAVAASDRDDLDLARAFAAAGRRAGVVNAADLAVTRHYRSAAEIASAWDRLFDAYVGHSLPAALATFAMELATWVLPPVLLLMALADAAGLVRLRPPWSGLPVTTGVALVAFMLAARLVLAAWQRQPLAPALWCPLTASATVMLQAHSTWAALLARPRTWRGRAIDRSSPANPVSLPSMVGEGPADPTFSTAGSPAGSERAS
jgi:4-hydroxybenzoate polyprenyltransferase/glycosyltransferase involved in cell wall biosynthesis